MGWEGGFGFDLMELGGALPWWERKGKLENGDVASVVRYVEMG
jgi:hypothetical protein